jgi:PAS domain S-box-containing protein
MVESSARGTSGAAAAGLAPHTERLRFALEAGGLGVWQWYRDTGVTEWDPTVEALFGVPPGTFGGTFDEWAERIHPDDRTRVLARVAEATEAGTDYVVEHRIVRPDGTIRWVLGHARAVKEDGTVTGYIGVTEDVTERHRSEAERAELLASESAARAAAEAANERLEFLAAATTALSETLDHTERLSRLAAAGVPRIADCAAIHLREGDAVRLVAVYHVDPEHERRLRSFVDRWPVRLDAPAGVGASIREGVVSFMQEITDDVLVAAAHDDEHLAELRRLGLASGLTVPLRGRDAPIGALSLITVGERRLDDADLTLARELGSRAGILIENGMLIEERERAEREQRYQAALLGALYEAGVDGILVVDPEGFVLSRNQRFADIWGLPDEAAATLSDDSLLDQAMRKVADPQAFLARVRELYADPSQPAHDEVLLADGRVLDRHGVPLHGDDGSYLGWAWTFRDVTRERRQQREIAAAGERFAAVARTLQQSLLPPRLPAPDGIDLAARYHPALEGVEVGGDFYDVFAVEGGWCVVLGDVCGKGPEAARVTGLVRWTLRAAAMRTTDPVAMLRELNTVMLGDAADEDADPRFATVCCINVTARPDGGLWLDVASAGHPAPLVVDAEGGVRGLELTGTPVGLFEEIELRPTSLALEAGEGLVLVTDGVLEARDHSGRELDVDGVVSALGSAPERTARALSAAVERRALDHQGGVAHDDIAVLVLVASPLER